jgi:hypothetical protein
MRLIRIICFDVAPWLGDARADPNPPRLSAKADNIPSQEGNSASFLLMQKKSHPSWRKTVSDGAIYHVLSKTAILSIWQLNEFCRKKE